MSKKDLELHESLNDQETSQIDKLVLKYAKTCNDKRLNNIKNEIELKTSANCGQFQCEQLKIGNAIKVRKNVRFTEEQIKFLVDLERVVFKKNYKKNLKKYSEIKCR